MNNIHAKTTHFAATGPRQSKCSRIAAQSAEGARVKLQFPLGICPKAVQGHVHNHVEYVSWNPLHDRFYRYRARRSCAKSQSCRLSVDLIRRIEARPLRCTVKRDDTVDAGLRFDYSFSGIPTRYLWLLWRPNWTRSPQRPNGSGFGPLVRYRRRKGPAMCKCRVRFGAARRRAALRTWMKGGTRSIWLHG